MALKKDHGGLVQDQSSGGCARGIEASRTLEIRRDDAH